MALKDRRISADRTAMNTFVASANRVPRIAVIALAVLIVAFAALMIVRSGLLGGTSSDATTAAPSLPRPSPAQTSTPTRKPAATKVVLLPGLPSQIAARLRYSKVVVVSVYSGTSAPDRAAVALARKGARAAGAGFTAVNVSNDKSAGSMSGFVGPVTSPSMLVVKRPGKIVTQIDGSVDPAVVAQAAHNAGARR
jgi:hypothetical protein